MPAHAPSGRFLGLSVGNREALRFSGAAGVAHFQRAMMMDVDQSAKAMKDADIEAEIEDFLEGFNQPTYRGMRINGSGWLHG